MESLKNSLIQVIQANRSASIHDRHYHCHWLCDLKSVDWLDTETNKRTDSRHKKYDKLHRLTYTCLISTSPIMCARCNGRTYRSIWHIKSKNWEKNCIHFFFAQNHSLKCIQITRAHMNVNFMALRWNMKNHTNKRYLLAHFSHFSISIVRARETHSCGRTSEKEKPSSDAKIAVYCVLLYVRWRQRVIETLTCYKAKITYNFSKQKLWPPGSQNNDLYIGKQSLFGEAHSRTVLIIVRLLLSTACRNLRFLFSSSCRAFFSFFAQVLT